LNFFQRAGFRIIKNLGFDEYVRQFLTGDDVYDGNRYGYVDSQTAMKYSAVFACIRVLAETLAGAPIMLYRKKENGERESRNDLAVYDILHNCPNEEMSPFNYKEACMVAINLGGNTVSQRLVNKYGELIGLYPYEWSKVEITRDRDTKALIYKIRDGVKTKELSRSEVFHLPGLSLDGVFGLSPIEYTSSAIRLGLSYEQFGVNFYKNGANASGAITVPGELSDTAYDRLKKDFAKNYQGLANTGKPIVLEGGSTFNQLTIKPADAQLIENKRFQIEDICRIYRVPQHLVQMLVNSTNNNIEHQSLEFVMYTMLPWFKRWEEGINMQLLTSLERRSGFYLEFNVNSLLRGDSKSRAEAYAFGRLNGWLSVNDIRKLENMNSIPNGDVYLQPLNYINVDIATEVQLKDQQGQQNAKMENAMEEIYKILKV
jgi:HK97 family phage portal protein